MNEKIDIIFSSSSPRAYQTAQLIRGNRPITIAKCDEFKEINLGVWEGKRQEDVMAENPEQFEYFWNQPSQFQVTGSETFEDVQQRALLKLDEIMQDYKGKNVLIVTHTVVVKILMAYFEGRELDLIWNHPYIHPACLCKVEIADEQAHILLHGDISHYQENIHLQAEAKTANREKGVIWKE